MDAGQPCLEICEDEMDDGQKPYSQTNTTPGGCMRQPDKHGTNIAQNMTLANNFHGPPAGVTSAAATGRGCGAGPPRRSPVAVERPPLPVQKQILCGWTAAGLGRLIFHTSMEATDAFNHLRDRCR